MLACIGFLYKVVHKIGPLRKFNRSREIEFNFLTAWTISMKFGTRVQYAPQYYKTGPQIFKFLPRDLVMVFQSRKRGKIITKHTLVHMQNLKTLRQVFVDLPFFFHSAKTVFVYCNS